ncbi:uncharacterized protein [Onthophagus taurus]|uniref:uncharacterized protein n=1 Tax=Onthophagus taurus TaxID=166361 RepID=UPI0039BEC8F3
MSSESSTPKPSAASTPQARPSGGEDFIEVRHRRYRQRPCGAELKRRKKERDRILASENLKPGHSRAPHKPPRGARTNQPLQSGRKDVRTQGQARAQPEQQRFATSTEPSLRESKRKWQESALDKSAQQGPKKGFKDALLSHLKVAVINSQNQLGKLSETEAGHVKYELTNALFKVITQLDPKQQTPIPTFTSMVYAGQILKVACNDDHSLTWLKAAVPLIPPLEGVVLSVVREVDLPTLSRIQVWIPDTDVDVNTREQTLQILAAQNRHLDVVNWCLFRYEVRTDPVGRLIVFGAGKNDAEWLKIHEGRICYLFNTLKARVGRLKDPEQGVGAAAEGETAERMETADVPTAEEDENTLVNLDVDPKIPASSKVLEESIPDTPPLRTASADQLASSK